jgi:hypothetical protein
LILNSNSCNQRVIITRCQLWACAFRKVVIYNTKETFPFLENTPNNLSTISKWGRKRRYYISTEIVYMYSLAKVIFDLHLKQQNRMRPRKSHRNELPLHFGFHSCVSVSISKQYICTSVYSAIVDIPARDDGAKDRCQLCGFTTPDGHIRDVSTVLCFSWSKPSPSSTLTACIVVCRTDVLRSVCVWLVLPTAEIRSKVCETSHQILKGPWHLEFTLSLCG